MRFQRLAAIPLLVLPTLSLSWNAEGHRQIADLAWLRLTPKTKAAVTRILTKADPKFRATPGDARSAREAFRGISVMPDVIKGDRRTAYEPIIDGYNRNWLPNPDPKEREQELCKTWHYYDVPIRYAGPMPKVSESNANNALLLARRELTKLCGGADDLRASWWLGWIEHLVGDLHQPLHCVSNYAVNAREGDAGGNGVKLGLKGRNGRPLALHAYWDEGIDHAKAAERAGRGSTSLEATSPKWLADAAFRPQAKAVAVQDPMAWIRTGAKLADQYVYAGEIRDAAVPSAGYEDAHRRLSKRQAILAGTRLAAGLNAIFDPRK